MINFKLLIIYNLLYRYLNDFLCNICLIVKTFLLFYLKLYSIETQQLKTLNSQFNKEKQ